MNAAQRKSYHGWRWPLVCKVQGWDQLPPAAREAKRREVTRAACGVDSTSRLSEHQITALFRRLSALSKPGDLAAAMADAATPEQVIHENSCSQLIWRIRESAKRDKVRLNDAYIQTLAAWDCREAQVTRWTDLPAPSLLRVLKHVNQRANEKDPEVNQRGPNRSKPAAEQFVYEMKPRKSYGKGVAA